MKIARDDLKRLRTPLALAVVLFALGAASLVVSEHYRDEAKKARDITRMSRVAAQERVSKVSEEEREMRENLVYYERMRRSGMLGEQNRLDWIDSIAKIKNDRKLFEIKYGIEPQKPLDYPGIVAAGAADFVVSRMKLEMALLHEEDLLDFLADLQTAGRAYVSVRRCTVTRIERGSVPAATALQPRLRADCQLDLVSVGRIKPV
ncbi:MAG: hypothetical protein E6H75_09815 [Betaproteobacteria bacterium]|nr:MAG: hypothetical protein E6H75_09815 [Betaproteobacteria bacterium]